MSTRRELIAESWDYPEAVPLEFRLTYEGPLYATQRDPVGNQPMPIPKRDHKRAIRRVFHRQLRRLWETVPFLKRGTTAGPMEADIGSWDEGREAEPHTIENLSRLNALYGFNFVPLVTEDIGLQCALDILFLRPDEPGKVIQSGDIDNRLKTLFDALRVPVPGEGWAELTPAADERPFFCLLEDDKLITKISVETDQLIDPSKLTSPHDVQMVIKVTVRPSEVHGGNLPFV